MPSRRCAAPVYAFSFSDISALPSLQLWSEAKRKTEQDSLTPALPPPKRAARPELA